MQVNEFRRIALSLPEAVEGEHMRHPDFRVGGKVFATLGYPDAEHGMVKLAHEQQERFLRLYPAAFSPAAGAWGRAGSTIVALKAAKKAMIDDALRAAWHNTAPKKMIEQFDNERQGKETK